MTETNKNILLQDGGDVKCADTRIFLSTGSEIKSSLDLTSCWKDPSTYPVTQTEDERRAADAAYIKGIHDKGMDAHKADMEEIYQRGLRAFRKALEDDLINTLALVPIKTTRAARIYDDFLRHLSDFSLEINPGETYWAVRKIAKHDEGEIDREDEDHACRSCQDMVGIAQDVLDDWADAKKTPAEEVKLS